MCETARLRVGFSKVLPNRLPRFPPIRTRSAARRVAIRREGIQKDSICSFCLDIAARRLRRLRTHRELISLAIGPTVALAPAIASELAKPNGATRAGSSHVG